MNILSSSKLEGDHECWVRKCVEKARLPIYSLIQPINGAVLIAMIATHGVAVSDNVAVPVLTKTSKSLAL